VRHLSGVQWQLAIAMYPSLRTRRVVHPSLECHSILVRRRGLGRRRVWHLDEGVDINAVDEEGNTPTHLAARNPDISLIQELLERGAEVNAMSNLGQSPLHEAAIHGQLDAVSLLLQQKADVDLASSAGMTALHYVAQNGQVGRQEEIAVTLLESRADVNALNKEGGNSTPFSLAEDMGTVEMQRIVQSYGGRRANQ